MFELPLKIVPLNLDTVLLAFKFMRKYGVKPRDCIHISCMLENNVKTIVTEDLDFRKVKEVKAVSISEFIKTYLKI
jgi:predicted nucleic acid-binding protein